MAKSPAKPTPARRPATKGATRRPSAGAGASRPGSSGRPAGLLTLITVGAIVAVIVAIVVIKVTSSTPTPSKEFQPTPAAIAAQVTGVPASVFNAVGVVPNGAVPVYKPTLVANQPPLRWAKKGVVRPTVFYYGAEFCPYCAAERWPMIIALSRFGTFSNLGNMQSSSTDLYKDTQTFTLVRATYTSSYVNFFPDEGLSNIPANTASGWTVLQAPTKAEQALLTKYGNSKYIPGASAGTIPFIDINNHYFIDGATFLPSALAGDSRAQIAAVLSDPSNPLTIGIITSANFFTAAVCQATGQQPASVCNTAGVKAADASMKITVSP